LNMDRRTGLLEDYCCFPF